MTISVVEAPYTAVMNQKIPQPLRRLARTIFARVSGRPRMEWVSFSSWQEHLVHQPREAEEIRRRRELERALATAAGVRPFIVPGYCWVCRREAAFEVDYNYAFPIDGLLTPNWREQLRCPQCGLYNRIRATLQFLQERVLDTPAQSIYIAEQSTTLFHYLVTQYPNLVGSEYLGDSVDFGVTNSAGFRNESLTRLTFPDNTFHCVITQDVLEHIPRFDRALTEVARVLQPGGAFLFTVPFRPDHEENLVRAVVEESGEIRHLLPPEYHGDPMQTAGCLAFYQFGWEILDHLRRVGFSEANAYPVWSRELGYLGDYHYLFLARKAA